MTCHCGFSIFVTEVQIKIEIHKSIIQIKKGGKFYRGLAPVIPQPTAGIVKKMLDHTHIQSFYLLT